MLWRIGLCLGSLLCIASIAALTAVSIASTATTATPDLPAEEPHADPLYFGFAGLLCKSDPGHLFAGHFSNSNQTECMSGCTLCQAFRSHPRLAGLSTYFQSTCQTLCDRNTSCTAYEWGNGCYLSSGSGVQAMCSNEDVKAPLQASVSARALGRYASHMYMYMCRLTFPLAASSPIHMYALYLRWMCDYAPTLSRVCQITCQRATCYIKSIVLPAANPESCGLAHAARGGCDTTVTKLPVSLAMARAKPLLNYTSSSWMRSSWMLRRDEGMLSSRGPSPVPRVGPPPG